ncbi:MAG: HAMP domain-containing histidine kinase [Methylophaga sp.]|nr:HAMP domain-containing histidine kinase [Methylophaga sp.]
MNNKLLKSKTFSIGSLYQWVLASFIIVSVPLIVVIVYTVLDVGKYTQQSQQTLFQAVKHTESSRVLLERLISMERNIRQFQVLDEPELFTSYLENRAIFLDVIWSLQAYTRDMDIFEKLEIIKSTEAQLHQDILTKSEKDTLQLAKSDLSAFDQLTTQARALVNDSEKRIGIEADTLAARSRHMQKRLIYAAFMGVSFALLLALIFVYFLTRPIRKVGQAIRNLGEIGFEEPIAIAGPKDITELGIRLESLRQTLNRLEQEKELFIRNISHELKTPLATLKEGTDLLADNVVGELNAEQQEIIQLMKIGNINIHNLVENLLEHQKIIATQIDLNFSTFALDELLERVIKDYQLLLQNRDISIKNSFNRTYIRADYEKLKIIISNLFSNALKFSPINGTIGISLLVEKDKVEFIIEDQGTGIFPGNQPFIFNDFYQGEVPKFEGIKGSGLGLSLVMHYLVAHNGTIELLPSNDVYLGARFSLQFPQSKDLN